MSIKTRQLVVTGDSIQIGTKILSVSGGNLTIDGSQISTSSGNITGDFITSAEVASVSGNLQTQINDIVIPDVSSFITSAEVASVSGNLQTQINNISGSNVDLATSSVFDLKDVSGTPTNNQVLTWSESLSAFTPLSFVGSNSGLDVTTTQLTLSVDQTTGIDANDKILFDQEIGDSLGLSSGQITIPSGHKAILVADLRIWFTSSSGGFTVGWYDVTNGQWVGTPISSRPVSSTANVISDDTAQAIVSTTINTVYELRVINNSGANRISQDASNAIITCYSNNLFSGSNIIKEVIADGTASFIDIPVNNLTEFDIEFLSPPVPLTDAAGVYLFFNGDETLTNYRSQVTQSINTTSATATENDTAVFTRLDDTYANFTHGKIRIINGYVISDFFSISIADSDLTYSQRYSHIYEIPVSNITSIKLQTYGATPNIPNDAKVILKNPNAGNQIQDTSVYVEATSTAGQTLTANVTPLEFATITENTSASWNGSSFTVPYDGVYTFYINVERTGSGYFNVATWIDGVRKGRICSNYGTSTSVADGSTTLKLSSGNVVEFISGESITRSSAPDFNLLTITKVA